jgi:two-component SAPR family response regulator
LNKKINIVVVDDCTDFVDILIQNLNELDYVNLIGFVHTESDALELLNRVEVDLVLIDIE